jgi:8-oxo-dGTP pyrophosphatase MutT (NUDIX family)
MKPAPETGAGFFLRGFMRVCGRLPLRYFEAMKDKKKAVRRATKGKPIRQVAAIPFRLSESGELQVMLITSRTTTRFIVPKGWPMKHKSGRKTAAIEATEEAGITGRVLRRALGNYRYWKRLDTGFVLVEVTAYLLAVENVLDDWKEAEKRQRAWLTPRDAASLIDEPQLATLLDSLTADGLALGR